MTGRFSRIVRRLALCAAALSLGAQAWATELKTPSRILFGHDQIFQPKSSYWQKVRFKNSFDQPISFNELPVVVMGPVSFKGGQAAFTRVRNITQEGFEFQVAEPPGYDGYHVPESVSYMAMEPGVHVVGDTAIYADRVQVFSSNSESFEVPEAFLKRAPQEAGAPLVFTQQTGALNFLDAGDSTASLGDSQVWPSVRAFFKPRNQKLVFSLNTKYQNDEPRVQATIDFVSLYPGATQTLEGVVIQAGHEAGLYASHFQEKQIEAQTLRLSPDYDYSGHSQAHLFTQAISDYSNDKSIYRVVRAAPQDGYFQLGIQNYPEAKRIKSSAWLFVSEPKSENNIQVGGFKLVEATNHSNVDFNLTIAADNFAEIYLDGELLGNTQQWWQSAQFQASLKPGKHVLAIKAQDFGGIAGVLAQIELGGVIQNTNDPKTWRVSTQSPTDEGWRQVDLPKDSIDFSPGSFSSQSYLQAAEPWKQNVLNFPKDSKARWVWSADNENDNEVYMRYEFFVGNPIDLQVAVDDLSKVYIDGVLVGETSNWRQSLTFEGLLLNKGPHLLAIEAKNRKGVAGVLVNLASQDRRQVVRMDRPLYARPGIPEGWTENDYFSFNPTYDNLFKPATFYGEYGVGPWRQRVSGMGNEGRPGWYWDESNRDSGEVLNMRYGLIIR